MRRAHSPIAPEPYDLAAPLREGSRIALLANSFLDCDLLMAEIGAAVAALRPGVTLKAYNKGTTSPAPEALIAQMTAECDLAVVAVAH